MTLQEFLFQAIREAFIGKRICVKVEWISDPRTVLTAEWRIKDTLEVTVIDVTFGKNCVVLKTDSRETPKIEVAFVDFGWEGLQTHSCRISHNYDGLGWSEISVDDGARIVKNTH